MTLSLHASATYAVARTRALYEPSERSMQRSESAPWPLQSQAASLPTDKESRQAFQRSPETGSEGLPGLQLTPKEGVASGLEVTKSMVDGRNASKIPRWQL